MLRTRMQIEEETISKMILLYCRKNHHEQLCQDCQELLDYSIYRLHKCPFGEEKTVCGSCSIKCYDKQHSEQIRTVMRSMRFAMLVYHPALTTIYLFNKLKGGKARK